MKLPVVYQDDDIAIVDKPAGLLVHPPVGSKEPTLADFARGISSDVDALRPGIVHRLDRDTSGLVIIAKTAAAKAKLQRLFKQSKIKKTYLALVVGRLDPPAAVIKLPLARRQNSLKRAVDPQGKPAETAYRTLASYPGYSYLEVTPRTGRTHQIRVHLASLRHPVVGDRLYGHQMPGLARQFLHASRLQFKAPSGRLVDVASPLSPDLADFLKKLQS